VDNAEIAAVVINTPGKKPLGVLKRYYANDHEGEKHWFLKSGNPSAKHLVVIPSHTNPATILEMYDRQIKAGKVVLYKNAELKIAGKFIKVVKKS
jgi:hypothetical protein